MVATNSMRVLRDDRFIATEDGTTLQMLYRVECFGETVGYVRKVNHGAQRWLAYPAQAVMKNNRGSWTWLSLSKWARVGKYSRRSDAVKALVS